MVNCSSKNKNVLFFSQRQFNTAYIYISKSVNKSHINREYIISFNNYLYPHRGYSLHSTKKYLYMSPTVKKYIE